MYKKIFETQKQPLKNNYYLIWSQKEIFFLFPYFPLPPTPPPEKYYLEFELFHFFEVI